MPTVLIVEDERKMLRLLELNLSDGGYTTRSAASAEAALSLLRPESVVLALTDRALPGLTGL